MTTIEYLALPLHKRIFYKTLAVLASIPKGIARFFSKTIVSAIKKIGKAIASFFQNIYHNFVDGDWKTRTSYFVMGFGQISRGSILRGVFSLIFQITYIVFMILFGFKTLALLPTFGSMATTEYVPVDSVTGLPITLVNDDSFDILLISIFAIVYTLGFIFMWYSQINDSMELQCTRRIGRKHLSY